MTKAFASQADLAPKTVSFTKLSDNAYAYTAEGDPNTGVVIGDDGVIIIDATATPVMAQEVIRRIRKITHKPIRYVVLTHYHAVRVLGASAYGAQQVIASQETREMLKERGEQDFKSELERFPRLFQAVESIPGLTWPTMTFRGEMTLWLGALEVRLIHAGRGHTKGDTIVWLPAQRVLFSGDLVEFGATPYCGDAHFTDWPATLARLRELGPQKLVPGRGDALLSAESSLSALEQTESFTTALYANVQKGVAAGVSLKDIYKDTYTALKPRFGDWVIFDHCMPFNVTRAYDEACGLDHPRIWTAERDKEMWLALESD